MSRFLQLKKGFTLIELLIAITIIGILSATLIPRVANILPTARDGARKAAINDVVAAIESYNLDFDKYPTGSFCLTDTDEELHTGYSVGDFLQDYLRNNPPTFRDAGEGDCSDSVTFSPAGADDDFEYAIGLPVELGKSGNSTVVGKETEPEGDAEAEFYVIER